MEELASYDCVYDALNVKSRIKPSPEQRKHVISEINDQECMPFYDTCFVMDRQQRCSKHDSKACINCPLEWLNDVPLRLLTKFIDKLQIEHQYSNDTDQIFTMDLDDYEDISSRDYEKDCVLDRDYMVNQHSKSVLTGGSDIEFLLKLNHNDEGTLC
jgi:hypothetical protein